MNYEAMIRDHLTAIRTRQKEIAWILCQVEQVVYLKQTDLFDVRYPDEKKEGPETLLKQADLFDVRYPDEKKEGPGTVPETLKTGP